MGIATRWSARAASSSGSPHASLPNSQAVGPASGGVVQPDLAGAVGGQHGQPGRPGGPDGGLGRRLDGDGRWNRLPTLARTVLGL